MHLRAAVAWMHENKESYFYSQAFVTCVTNSVYNFNEQKSLV